MDLKDQKIKLESEIKTNEDKWMKESELTRKLMELRKKKFRKKRTGIKNEDPDIIKEIEKVREELKALQIGSAGICRSNSEYRCRSY